MSRIFTWEQISAGLVPQPNDFTAVCNTLREELTRFPTIHGAIICGSVLMGTASPSSDLDVLVTYRIRDPTERIETLRFLADLVKKAYARHVPLSLIPINAELAGQGCHSFTIGFVSHLAWARDHGGLIGQDPLTVIPVYDTPEHRRQETRSYITHCLESLEKGVLKLDVLSEEKSNTVRHRALDMPFHATRRVLECHGYDCGNITRYGLMEKLNALGGERTVRRLALINNFLVGYRKLIEDQSAKKDRVSYELFMSQFTMVMSEAVEFLYTIREFV